MLYYAERPEISKRLSDQLDQARVAHHTACERLNLLVKECPGELPHPDGALRIQHAGRNSSSALQRYMAALNRYTDFTLYGTIPEDLLPPD
jgi:hypothetical protein